MTSSLHKYFNGDKPATIRILARLMFTLGVIAAIIGIILLLGAPIGVINGTMRRTLDAVGIITLASALSAGGIALIRVAREL